MVDELLSFIKMTKEDLNFIYFIFFNSNLSDNSEEIKNINGLSGSQLAFISSSLFLNKKLIFLYFSEKRICTII